MDSNPWPHCDAGTQYQLQLSNQLEAGHIVSSQYDTFVKSNNS